MAGRRPPRPLAPPEHVAVPRPRSEQPERTEVSAPPRLPTTPRPTRTPVETGPSPSDRWRRVVSALVVAVGLLILAATARVFLVHGTDGRLSSADTGDLDRAPVAPVELVPQTSWVVTRITASGDVRARHWIRSDRDLFGVGLAVPPSARAAGSPPLQVRGIRVIANGRVVAGRERLRGGRGFYPFAGTTEVFIRYRLEGAVERTGSVAERALARLVALDIDLTRPLRATTYAVSGGEVLNLACARPHQGAVPVPCGRPVGAGWQVRLTRADRNGVVSAQLDLP